MNEFGGLILGEIRQACRIVRIIETMWNDGQRWDLMAYHAKLQFCKMKRSIGRIYKCTSIDEEYL